MERVNYREIIETILTNHTGNDLETETEVQLLFDREREHYQVIHLGWKKEGRVYGCVTHVDIKDGKFWIQRDRTESGIANELVAAGVPKEKIVLAFKAPYLRPFTGFAIESIEVRNRVSFLMSRCGCKSDRRNPVSCPGFFSLSPHIPVLAHSYSPLCHA